MNEKARKPGLDVSEVPNEQVVVDIVLVTCVKSKRSGPAAAKDLYTSPLFKKERAYAEQSGKPWFILSAEHGLVAPDEWLAPYERYLPDTPAEYRTAWGLWVAARLELLVGPLTGLVVEVHASSVYVGAVKPELERRGAAVYEPLRGLAMGRRLAWYPELDSMAETVSQSVNSVSPIVAALLRIDDSMSPQEFLDHGRPISDAPGLYSWWVDRTGAEQLSRGLEMVVAPGLIYAGLAGATRWPSGKRSSNTLWSRIVTMHLGGSHEFSTFRRTLGAILAAANAQNDIDERALTEWMNQHLRLVVVADRDRDRLGHLERDVLSDLDPPFNLQGMDRTPLRDRLKELRRRHSGRGVGGSPA